MLAIGIDEFGETPHEMELPAPAPGPGEVLVRLRAAALNPVDAQVAAGFLGGQFRHAFPLVLGFDGAGEVRAVGDGVETLAEGDLVFGQFWSDPIGQGSFAEWALATEQPAFGSLVRIPGGIAPEVAAAIPTSGQTAFGAVEKLALTGDSTLLVLGATGGVGSYAVQLAARSGARVIATARPDAAAWIRELGAAETIDHAAGVVPDQLEGLCPEGVDALLDTVGDRDLFAACAARVKDGGTALSVAFAAGEELTAETRISAGNYMNVDKPRLLSRIAAEVAAGTVTPQISREISLAGVPDAMAAGAPRSRGKTVVRIGDGR